VNRITQPDKELELRLASATAPVKDVTPAIIVEIDRGLRFEHPIAGPTGKLEARRAHPVRASSTAACVGF
jgi:hypothetical protein